MDRSLLMTFGLAIWWGEGSKSRRDKRWKNAVSYPIEITNTNPLIIKIAMMFLVDELSVPIEKLRIQIQIHEGDNLDQCLAFWSKTTGVSLEKFQKTIVRPKGNKPGKTMGTCKIRWSDKETYCKMRRLLDEIIEEIVPGCGAVG